MTRAVGLSHGSEPRSSASGVGLGALLLWVLADRTVDSGAWDAVGLATLNLGPFAAGLVAGLLRRLGPRDGAITGLLSGLALAAASTAGLILVGVLGDPSGNPIDFGDPSPAGMAISAGVIGLLSLPYFAVLALVGGVVGALAGERLRE